jgi:hypothetical protein
LRFLSRGVADVDDSLSVIMLRAEVQRAGLDERSL